MPAVHAPTRRSVPFQLLFNCNRCVTASNCPATAFSNRRQPPFSRSGSHPLASLPFKRIPAPTLLPMTFPDAKRQYRPLPRRPGGLSDRGADGAQGAGWCHTSFPPPPPLPHHQAPISPPSDPRYGSGYVAIWTCHYCWAVELSSDTIHRW